MSTVAILLVILSAAMHAGRNYLTKKATDKQAFVWWYEVVGLLLFTPLFLIYFLAASMASLPVWDLILASGLLHFVYWVLLTKSLETGDLSLVYPIMRSSPALVLLLSIFVLNEAVSPQGLAGILLVALASYTINMQRLSVAELVRPLRAISHSRLLQTDATSSRMTSRLPSIVRSSIAGRMSRKMVRMNSSIVSTTGRKMRKGMRPIKLLICAVIMSFNRTAAEWREIG